MGGLNTAHFDDSDLVEAEEVIDNKQQDENMKKKDKKASRKRKKEPESELPKIKKKGTTPVIDTQLDLDTSDSEVNEAVERMRSSQKEQMMMGGTPGDLAMLSDEQIKTIKEARKKQDIQNRMKVFFSNADMLIYNDKNVSKTFKKMLNTQRMISSRRNLKNLKQTTCEHGHDSKASQRRSKKRFEAEQDINREIEKKFQRKMGTLPITQKGDQQFAEVFGDRKDKWKGGMKPG